MLERLVLLVSVVCGAARPLFIRWRPNPHIQRSYQAAAHGLTGWLACGMYYHVGPGWYWWAFWALAAIEVVCAVLTILDKRRAA